MIQLAWQVRDNLETLDQNHANQAATVIGQGAELVERPYEDTELIVAYVQNAGLDLNTAILVETCAQRIIDVHDIVENNWAGYTWLQAHMNGNVLELQEAELDELKEFATEAKRMFIQETGATIGFAWVAHPDLDAKPVSTLSTGSGNEATQAALDSAEAKHQAIKKRDGYVEVTAWFKELDFKEKIALIAGVLNQHQDFAFVIESDEYNKQAATIFAMFAAVHGIGEINKLFKECQDVAADYEQRIEDAYDNGSQTQAEQLEQELLDKVTDLNNQLKVDLPQFNTAVENIISNM